MPPKPELEKRLVRINKQIQDLIINYYMKLKDLVEEQNLIRLKLKKRQRIENLESKNNANKVLAILKQ